MRALLLMALIGVLAAPHARAQTKDPFALTTEKLTLSNGLTLLLAPDPRSRLASVVVSYRAGSADDPDGLRGLAHMVEHVAWLGGKHTAHRLQQLEAAGVCHFNAVTTLDATSYFESIPPEHLSTVLWLESDRMGYAAEAVSEARVDGQRAAVANEARDHFDTMLAAVGPFGARALFPDWHPYAGLADNEDDLRHIHASDVLAFLRTWYSPANATLAIAGAFDRDATIAAVNRYFGSLPSTALPARPALREWTPSAVTLIVAAPLGYDSVTLAWRTPLYGTSDDAALDLATGALAGAANTRFADSLVSAGLATTISATQSSGLEASVFFVQARVAPGADPGRVATVIQDTITDFAASTDAAEADRSRGLLRDSTLIGLETTWGRAGRLVAMDRIGVPIGPGFDWGLGRHASIGADAVRRAAATWLTRDHRVTTLIYSDRSAPFRGALLRREARTP